MPEAQYTIDREEITSLWWVEDPNIDLDLTMLRLHLKAGQASVVLGRDVSTPGRIRPDRGRKPVGAALAESSRNLTDAFSSKLFGRQGVRFSDIVESGRTLYTVAAGTLAKSQAEFDKSGPWDAEVVGAYLIENSDGRMGDAERGLIHKLSTTTNLNDTVNFRGGFTVSTSNSKFSISYSKSFE